MDKTRLIFTLPKEIHARLRRAAFKRNISISLYILQAIVFRLESEKD